MLLIGGGYTQRKDTRHHFASCEGLVQWDLHERHLERPGVRRRLADAAARRPMVP